MQYTLALLALAAAVQASPLPQAVTAMIKPSGTTPPGCMPTFVGSFGITVINISTATAVKRAVSQISDGQVQAPTGVTTVAVVSQIGDGQIQAPRVTILPIVITTTARVTVAPISQIGDGQPQAPKATTAPTTTTPRSTAAAVSQITDGQPQAPKPATSTTSIAKASMSTMSIKPQASTSTVSRASMAAAPSSTAGARMVACQTNGTLALTLNKGILKDSRGRTGYIASNFQFQFDDPPQAGALITAGFSVCGNGSLALGASNVFYKCLSGNFYNLYDRNWAPQCSPVTISTLELIGCPT